MDGVGPSHSGPVVPFRRVLMLMVGFRMPTTAVVHVEYVFDFVRNYDLCIVTDEHTLTEFQPKRSLV